MEVLEILHNLYGLQLNVPAEQIALLLLLSTLALLFGKMKIALLINYLFTLYWGYFLNKDVLMGAIRDIPYFTYVYFGSGLAIALLALIIFITHKE